MLEQTPVRANFPTGSGKASARPATVGLFVGKKTVTQLTSPRLVAKPATRHPFLRRRLRKAIHFFAYHLVIRRKSTWRTQVSGMNLEVRPTVFHPRYFLSSARFADFIKGLDLVGKHVVDVGTGSGILAIAAAQAGAARVMATDINPSACLSVPHNARENGVSDRVTAVCMDGLAGFASQPLFDVIVGNLPKHSEEPRDLGDKGWHSGPRHRDIARVFEQAHERLRPGGVLYVMFSTDSEIEVIETLIVRSGFVLRVAKTYSIYIESFLLYECALSQTLS